LCFHNEFKGKDAKAFMGERRGGAVIFTREKKKKKGGKSALSEVATTITR